MKIFAYVCLFSFFVTNHLWGKSGHVWEDEIPKKYKSFEPPKIRTTNGDEIQFAMTISKPFLREDGTCYYDVVVNGADGSRLQNQERVLFFEKTHQCREYMSNPLFSVEKWEDKLMPILTLNLQTFSQHLNSHLEEYIGYLSFFDSELNYYKNEIWGRDWKNTNAYIDYIELVAIDMYKKLAKEHSVTNFHKWSHYDQVSTEVRNRIDALSSGDSLLSILISDRLEYFPIYNFKGYALVVIFRDFGMFKKMQELNELYFRAKINISKRREIVAEMRTYWPGELEDVYENQWDINYIGRLKFIDHYGEIAFFQDTLNEIAGFLQDQDSQGQQ